MVDDVAFFRRFHGFRGCIRYFRDRVCVIMNAIDKSIHADVVLDRDYTQTYFPVGAHHG